MSHLIETCNNCGGPIGEDSGPPDGWELEDGRVVCQACCVRDLTDQDRDPSYLVVFRCRKGFQDKLKQDVV